MQSIHQNLLITQRQLIKYFKNKVNYIDGNSGAVKPRLNNVNYTNGILKCFLMTTLSSLIFYYNTYFVCLISLCDEW